MNPPSIAGIVLAAGTGTRMGDIKQLLPYQGRPMLEQVVNTALGAGLDPVIVVLGHAARRIGAQVNLSSAKVVHNPRHRQGQSTSLQAGLAKVPAGCPAAMFLLADQPLVGREVIAALTQAYHRSRPWVVVPEFKGRRGNPVIIDRALFARIGELTGDTGARGIIDAHPERTLRVAVAGDGIHFDVDRPRDYQRLLARRQPEPGEAGRDGRRTASAMQVIDALRLKAGMTVSVVGAGGKTTLIYTAAREAARAGAAALVTTTTAILHPDREGRPFHRLLVGDTQAPGLAGYAAAGKVVVAARAVIEDGAKLKGFAPQRIDALQAGGWFDHIFVEADGAAGLPVKAPAGHEPVVPECSDVTVGVIGLDCLGQPLNHAVAHRPHRLAAVTGLAPGELISSQALVALVAAPNGLFKSARRRKIVLLNKADDRRLQDAGSELAGQIMGRCPDVERVVLARLQNADPVCALFP